MSNQDSLVNRRTNLSPTKRALLARWQKRKITEFPGQEENIPRRRDTSIAPLSFAQQRIWFFEQFKPGNHLYNLTDAFRLTGSLFIYQLERSFIELIRRHETLRTTFTSSEGSPSQVIAPANTISTIKMPLVELTMLTQDEQDAEIARCVQEEMLRPFDLSNGPLIRLSLLRLNALEQVLILTTHHIIFDGWSYGVFFRELATLYQALLAQKLPSLPNLPIQYGDFAFWQQQWLQGEKLQELLAYWRGQLQGAPSILNLPTDYTRPPVQTYKGAAQTFAFSPELSQQLNIVSQHEGVTLYMTLLTGFQIVLAYLSQQEDFVIGTSIAGRTQSELEGLIGFFVNTLPLRVRLAGTSRLRELLNQTREIALGAYAHQELPFEKLVEALQPERTLSHAPLVQIILVLQNGTLPHLQLEGLTTRALNISAPIAKFDLSLYVVEEEKVLRGLLEYNTDIFSQSTSVNICKYFEKTLETIVTTPDVNYSDMQKLLMEMDQQQKKQKEKVLEGTSLNRLNKAKRKAVNDTSKRG